MERVRTGKTGERQRRHLCCVYARAWLDIQIRNCLTPRMTALLKILRSGLSLGNSFHSTGRLRSKKLPNPWVLATGKELWEAIQHKKGNVDPFLVEPIERGPGTRDCPIVILSPFNKRLVGCVCNEDVNHVVWFWLHECYPRRCMCNYWFVLERFEMPKFYEDTCPCE